MLHAHSPGIPGLNSLHLARSAALVGAVAWAAFWNTPPIFAYDDTGTIVHHRVVTAEEPWWRVFALDYWGTEIGHASSHKSWRPLTTLTFRWNYLTCRRDPTCFSRTNVLLHVIASVLVLWVARTLLSREPASSRGRQESTALWSALLFATHPVHSEAVDNISARADVLMAVFFLAGLLCYFGWGRRRAQVGPSGLMLFVTALCTCAALISKETGIMLPVTVVVWDLVLCIHHWARKEAGWADFLARAFLLALLTCGLALGRLHINGEDTNGTLQPRFHFNQNRAAFHPVVWSRCLSIAWVWLDYLHVLVFPRTLSCHWQGSTLPTIDSVDDPRIFVIGVAALGGAAAAIHTLRQARRGKQVAFTLSLTLFLLPFALASNLITPIGALKAEVCSPHLCPWLSASTHLDIHVTTASAVPAPGLSALRRLLRYGIPWPSRIERPVLPHKPDTVPARCEDRRLCHLYWISGTYLVSQRRLGVHADHYGSYNTRRAEGFPVRLCPRLQSRRDRLRRSGSGGGEPCCSDGGHGRWESKSYVPVGKLSSDDGSYQRCCRAPSPGAGIDCLHGDLGTGAGAWAAQHSDVSRSGWPIEGNRSTGHAF